MSLCSSFERFLYVVFLNFVSENRQFWFEENNKQTCFCAQDTKCHHAPVFIATFSIPIEILSLKVYCTCVLTFFSIKKLHEQR